MQGHFRKNPDKSRERERERERERVWAGYYKGPVLCDTVCTQNWFGVNIPNWRNFMESKERKWLGDVKARCFLISSITCYAIRESEREWRKEVSQHVIGPFPSTTKLPPENEANLLRLMKRKVGCRCARGCVDVSNIKHSHNVCYSWKGCKIVFFHRWNKIQIIRYSMHILATSASWR